MKNSKDRWAAALDAGQRVAAVERLARTATPDIVGGVYVPDTEPAPPPCGHERAQPGCGECDHREMDRRGELHAALCDLVQRHGLADVRWALGVIADDIGEEVEGP